MISIIVPIYNVEDYLPRCIDSILAQTEQNFELLLIDDGSPDRCGAICDIYATRDSRIHVIHKINGGLSDARNAGLQMAQGDLIAFMDSDDWVDPQYLEKMQDALLMSEADICECGVDIEKPCGTGVYETEQALSLLIGDKILRQHVWNKLYRRSCLEGILFPVGKTNEDEFWTYQVIGRASCVAKIDDPLYHYFQRPGSIMQTSYSLKRLDALEAKQLRQTYIETYFPALATQARLNLYGSCIFSGQMTLMYLDFDEQKQAVYQIDRIRAANIPSCSEIWTVGIQQRIWLLLSRAFFWPTCRLKNLLKKGL